MRFWRLGLRSIKETYRDPLALAFLLAFPFVFMLLFGVAFGSNVTPTYNVGVIDQDGSPLAQSFLAEALPQVETIKATAYDDTAAALADLRLGDLNAYIVLPEGFGDQVSRILQGQEGEIVINITYDESALLVSQQIISTINAAARVFAQIEIPLTIDANPINIETEITNIDFIAPGIIIFGLMIMISTSARIMLRDKENRFLYRLLTTPTRPWEFISGYSLGMVIIAVVQIITFILLGWLFGMDIVGNIGLAFGIFLLTAICSIGIGMIVASLTKSETQGESLSWLFSIPLALISGVWFSAEFMPEYIQAIAKAFPFIHAIDAARAIITRGVGFEAISGDVFFLVGWAVGIFALGIILFGRTMRS
jgi:ABC-2 type transport system permease protein